jgi:hypothetical protein
MSGVNRNILKNTSIPVMSNDQIPLELVSTTGTRFVLLNYPVKTYISSSQGGDCEGITVQWSTDSRFASEPDNYYTNITQSVLSCNSSSQIPLTSSLEWSIFVNSTYNTGSTSYYYVRSFQNSTGGGRGPYSNVVSLETRSPKLYTAATSSVIGGVTPLGSYSNAYNYSAYQAGTGQPWYPGCTGSVLAFSVDSFNPITGQLQAWTGDTNSGSAVTMSVASGSLLPIKAGGNNYDAIQTNGATMSFSLYGSPSGGLFQTNSIQDGGLQQWATNGGILDPAYNGVPYYRITGSAQNFPCAAGTLCNNYHMRSWTTSVGILSGSMTITGVEGYKVKYSAVSSSQNGDICLISGGVQYGNGFPTASTTINQVIGTVGNSSNGFANIQWTVGNNLIGSSSVPSNPAISSIGNQVTIETSPDCVFRTLTFGQSYNTNLFTQQYGNPYSVFSNNISSSRVLAIPSSSVLQLWSGFGYGKTPYSTNNYPQGYIGWMDNNNVASKWTLVNPKVPNSLVSGTFGYQFAENTAGSSGSTSLTILSSSVAGLSGSDFTLQFVGTLPVPVPTERYSLLGKFSTKAAIVRADISGTSSFFDLLTANGAPQYRYQVTGSSNNQILTVMRSGSTMSVYQGLNKLTSIAGAGGVWDLFANSTPGSGSFNFGDIEGPGVVFRPYSGQVNSLLIYSRSLSNAELTSSYNAFL